MAHQICIIGCGDMGNQHAGSWSRREDCRIVAVCDLIPERREALAALESIRTGQPVRIPRS